MMSRLISHDELAVMLQELKHFISAPDNLTMPTGGPGSLLPLSYDALLERVIWHSDTALHKMWEQRTPCTSMTVARMWRVHAAARATVTSFRNVQRARRVASALERPPPSCRVYCE